MTDKWAGLGLGLGNLPETGQQLRMSQYWLRCAGWGGGRGLVGLSEMQLSMQDLQC